MEKILQFTKDHNRYRKLALERADGGDLTGALSLLYTAKSIKEDYEVVMDIADVYADMGLLELSNKYWYKYMDIAPKEKVSVAYEELAINFFYMDNYLASSFYFHLKITTDGQITKEGLSPEIIDFFSGEEFKRDGYRVVYPYNLANYNLETKRSKHALAIGAFEEAKKSLSVIPDERKTEEISGDLAVAYFMTDDLDGAEKVCRDSLKLHGDNLTAYCNLSTVYDMREDFDNADYYYKKALENEKGDKGEEYKLATCAIERLDHPTVKRCLEKILEERPHELTMRFFYGLTYLNLGNYQRAVDELAKAYRLNPDDLITEYYLKLAKEFEAGRGDDNIFPLEYVKELPKKVQKDYSEKINSLAERQLKIKQEMKKADVFNMVKWGLFYGEEQTARSAVYLLATIFTQESKKVLLDALMEPDFSGEIKRTIMFVLLMKGYRRKFGLVTSNFCVKVRPRKLLLERVEDAYTAQYVGAYALCLVRAVFFDADCTDKIAHVTDKIFVKLKDKISPSDVTDDELGALILSECKFKWCKTDGEIVRLFGIDKQKLEYLKGLLKG